MTELDHQAKALYDACPTIKPAWKQLGETTQNVWRERAAQENDMPLTLEEQHRRAYADGDVQRAELLALASDGEGASEDLDELDSLRIERDDLQRTLDRVEELHAAEKERDDLQRTLDRVEELHAAEKERDDLQRTLDRVEEELHAAEKERDALRDELDDLRSLA